MARIKSVGYKGFNAASASSATTGRSGWMLWSGSFTISSSGADRTEYGGLGFEFVASSQSYMIMSASNGVGSIDLITNSGTIKTDKIIANSANITQITSSIVTSSIVHASGSNIFGDNISDTHDFKGHITASGNISTSYEIIGIINGGHF